MHKQSITRFHFAKVAHSENCKKQTSNPLKVRRRETFLQLKQLLANLFRKQQIQGRDDKGRMQHRIQDCRGGARNMKYKSPRMAAIFLWLVLSGTRWKGGGRGPLAPPLPPGSAAGVGGDTRTLALLAAIASCLLLNILNRPQRKTSNFHSFKHYEFYFTHLYIYFFVS